MSDKKTGKIESLDNDPTLITEENNTTNLEEPTISPSFGVQHESDGNIIKIAENAVPPEAWKNQKKAYSDAWENNKNQVEEDI